MKILVVNDILLGGGVEKLMYDIVTYFCNKHEFTILTDKKDKNFSNVYPENVKYLYQMEKDYDNDVKGIQRKFLNRRKKKREEELKKKIKDMNFDVMLCMKESWIMMMAMTYGEYIPKKFGWVHTDYSKSYYTKVWFGSEQAEVDYMKKFTNVICVSEVIEKSIKNMIGDPGNLKVIYNPVNKEEIVKKSSEEVYDIARSDRPLFVTVGRLNTQKGYDVLLEVCNILNEDGLDYEVWIIGGGEAWNHYEELHRLERKIREYKLDNVYLLGNKKNPYKYVRMADWFLSTSRYEGYSYVSQEAAIVETPLMLTECSGVMELLKTKDNGVVVENSVKGIYLGMKKAIEDKDFVKQYIGKLKPESNEWYWDDKMKEIENLFI